jgi:hypothetical protein
MRFPSSAALVSNAHQLIRRSNSSWTLSLSDKREIFFDIAETFL